VDAATSDVVVNPIPADDASEASTACASMAVQCTGNSVQTCGANGRWGDAVGCPSNAPICTGNGICSCQSGATQCSGDAVETCGPDGAWGNLWPCATGACVGGACAGSTTTAPSCAPGGPGMTNCGAGGSGNESCCTSLEVPGGTFYGIDVSRDGPLQANGQPALEAESMPATVSGFRLDKFLVTVSRFRQYVDYITGVTGVPPANGSGKHTHLNGGRGLVDGTVTSSWSAASNSWQPQPVTYETGWDATDWDAQLAPSGGISWSSLASQSWPTTAGSPEDLPITNITWYEAYAFCIWDGGFLPSATEWEYTAAGGSQEREYPWGSKGPDTYSTVNELSTVWSPQYAIVTCDYPTPVPAPAVGSTCMPIQSFCDPSACGQFNIGCGQIGQCDEGCGHTVGWTAGSCSVAPVGTALLGAGYWGQLDLVGDEVEWVLDVYPGPGLNACPGDDCAYVSVNNLGVAEETTPNRRVQGCDWYSYCSPHTLQGRPALNADTYKGFRCARTPYLRCGGQNSSGGYRASPRVESNGSAFLR
jgi:formylglycine-generating enzyme required for sulfatase activity